MVAPERWHLRFPIPIESHWKRHFGDVSRIPHNNYNGAVERPAHTRTRNGANYCIDEITLRRMG